MILSNKASHKNKNFQNSYCSNATLSILAILLCFLLLIVPSESSFSYLSSESNGINEKIDYTTEFVYNFTVPKNDPTNACLKLVASFQFIATYAKQSFSNGSYINATVNFTLPNNNFTFDGLCQSEMNMFELMFLNDWRLELYFFKGNNDSYVFNHVVLYYAFDGPLFPGSEHKGARSESYNQLIVNGTLNESVLCESGFRIKMEEVTIQMTDVHLEPFFNKRPNLPFDKALVCPNDKPAPILNNTSVFVPILVMSIFLFIILLSCFVYCCVKCKNNYQNVPANS